jgi:hypothetical protein
MSPREPQAQSATEHRAAGSGSQQAGPPRDKRALALALLLGFVLPAFVYALVITRGSLNLFDDEYGWQAYNAYALALANGRTDVPLEAIGAEGFIIDGRVYMYYGMLPAFARWLLMPFLDLEETPVSLLMTWLFCTIGAGALQAAVLRIYWSIGRRTPAAKGLLLAASLGVWLGSGPWLAVQNGNFYHEPFAAGLMLAGIAIYLLVDDAVLQARMPPVRRLCLYALLAGLAVFTRQTMAVSLYALALALIVAPILIEGWSRARVLLVIRRAVLPIAILAAFGVAYIWTNLVRFDGDSYPMESYGYYILFDSLKDTTQYFADKFRRLESMESVGRFHLVRIVPNLIYYLIGGADFRTELIERLGGGYTIAFGHPVRLLLAWAVPLLFAFAGFWGSLARPGRLYRLALVAAVGTGGLLQLAYATASYRYATEFWPIIVLLLCLGLAWALRKLSETSAGTRAASAVLIAAVAMVGYNIQFSPDLEKDFPDREGSLQQPMPPQLTRLVER